MHPVVLFYPPSEKFLLLLSNRIPGLYIFIQTGYYQIVGRVLHVMAGSYLG